VREAVAAVGQSRGVVSEIVLDELAAQQRVGLGLLRCHLGSRDGRWCRSRSVGFLLLLQARTGGRMCVCVSMPLHGRRGYAKARHGRHGRQGSRSSMMKVLMHPRRAQDRRTMRARVGMRMGCWGRSEDKGLLAHWSVTAGTRCDGEDEGLELVVVVGVVEAAPGGGR
jgi:hypothetical protein